MEKQIAKLLLENLLARIVVDPETGQGTLQGVLTPMEIEALHTASVSLLEISPAESFTPPKQPDPSLQQEEELDVKAPVEEVPEAEIERESTPEAELDSEPEREQASEPIPKPDPEPEELKAAPVTKEPHPEIHEEEEVEPAPDPEPEVKLNLDSLKFNAPQNPNIRLCLDFGTAMSKAFATDIEGDEVVEGLKIKLGHRGSGGTSKHIYPVPSTLWICDDGKIYLGEEAIVRSLHADPSGSRERFDSLKKELILGMKESTPFQQVMNHSLNPTDVHLSKGDAITLYLGYLTDLTCTEMEETHKCSRYIFRNFGLPSWAPERRSWGEDLLRKMLVKAQIVADTFHGQWDNGISVKAVKNVLDKIDDLEKFPDYLVGEGITEPLAAGSSRLRQDEPSRGLVMMVDVGAGTSDLALFVVVEDPERNLFNAFPVEGCNQSLHMAGDTLDSALQQTILKKAGIVPSDHDYSFIIQNLRKQIRSFKEDLFRDEYCVVNLVNGARVRVGLEEFLQEESVNRYQKNLADKFEDVLRGMTKSLAHRFGSGGLSVVLTGGGASLPMVKYLAKGTFTLHNIPLRKNEVAMVPEDFEDDVELATVYPQLAVAIGGTMPCIIDEKKPFGEIDIPQGQATLHRAQITGI